MVSETDFDIGRKVGVVARRNRQLYETVKTVAKKKNKKMGEVLEEALELWRLYETLEDIDPKSLIVAMSFVKQMLNEAVELLVKLGAVFTSEFVRTNLSMLSELAQQQTPPETNQVEKQEPNPLKDQMRLMMMQTVMPLIINIMQQLAGAIGGSTLGNTSMPTQPQIIKPQRKVVIEE